SGYPAGPRVQDRRPPSAAVCARRSALRSALPRDLFSGPWSSLSFGMAYYIRILCSSWRPILKYRAYLNSILVLCGTLALQTAWPAAQLDAASRDMAHDIFKQLIEINTTDSIGSTTAAAEAMAKRLLD